MIEGGDCGLNVRAVFGVIASLKKPFKNNAFRQAWLCLLRITIHVLLLGCNTLAAAMAILKTLPKVVLKWFCYSNNIQKLPKNSNRM